MKPHFSVSSLLFSELLPVFMLSWGQEISGSEHARHGNGIQTGGTVSCLTCSQFISDLESLQEQEDSPSMTPSVACPDRRGWSSIFMPSSMMHVSDCSPADRRSSDTRPVAISIRTRSDRTSKSCDTLQTFCSAGRSEDEDGKPVESVLSSVWHSLQLGGGKIENELK